MIAWLKAFHIVFVVAWFAGLFYLPRLFVYHADATDEPGIKRFVVMEHRLFALTSIAAALAAILGVAMIVAVPAYLRTDWLRMKLAAVGALAFYHLWCHSLVRAFRKTPAAPPHSSAWFRWFNEIPTVLLILIVILAVVKPGGIH